MALSDAQKKLCISFSGGGGGCKPFCDRGQSDQLPAVHHQGYEQERRRCYRSGQEEGWEEHYCLHVLN